MKKYVCTVCGYSYDEAAGDQGSHYHVWSGQRAPPRGFCLDGVIDIDRLNDTVDERVDENMMRYYYSGGAILFSTNEEFYLNREHRRPVSIVASTRKTHNRQTHMQTTTISIIDMRGSTTAIVDPDGDMVKSTSMTSSGTCKRRADLTIKSRLQLA